MSAVALARARIQAFADTHDLWFKERGEVGFGRACVGLMDGDSYLDFNPTRYVYERGGLNPSDIIRVEGFDDPRLMPPESVPDAYHQHDCLAVLVHDDDYDKAILQLADWVAHLEQIGVEIAEYETGRQGVHLLVAGRVARAVRVKRDGAS